MAIPNQTTADWQLQKKIHGQLTGQITDVNGNAVAVHDALKRNSDGEVDVARPFVVIGEGFSDDDSTTNTVGQTILQRILVESVYEGWREAKQMKSQVIARLDRTVFDLSPTYEHYHAKYNDDTPQRLIESNTGQVIRRYTIEFLYRITTL